jgi:hypothetical protein
MINHNRFKAMFVDETHLQLDDGSLETIEGYNEDMVERAHVIVIGGFLVVDDNGPFSYDNVNTHEDKRVICPHRANPILVTRYNGQEYQRV